jgi:hypothetical protein
MKFPKGTPPTTAITEHVSISTPLTRALDTNSPGGTALVTGLVIGSLILSVSLCVSLLKWKRNRAQKREEERVRQREADQAQAEQQAQYLSTIKDREESWRRRESNTINSYEQQLRSASLRSRDEPDKPSSEVLLERYKQEFVDKKRAEGVNEVTLQYLDADPDNVYPFDSASMIGVPIRAVIYALVHERDAFVSERLAMDGERRTQANTESVREGSPAVQYLNSNRSFSTSASVSSTRHLPPAQSPLSLTHQGNRERHAGPSGLQRYRTSNSQRTRIPPTWQGNNYSDIELENLVPPSPIHSAPGLFSSSSPPIPVRSASRSTQRTNRTFSLANQWVPGEHQMQPASSTHQLLRPARPDTLFSTFTRPSGFIPRGVSGITSEVPHGHQDSTGQGYETDISDDVYASEAGRNYARMEQERLALQIQGKDYVADLMRRDTERRQREFLEYKRKASEEQERIRKTEEESMWVKKGKLPEQ